MLLCNQCGSPLSDARSVCAECGAASSSGTEYGTEASKNSRFAGWKVATYVLGLTTVAATIGLLVTYDNLNNVKREVVPLLQTRVQSLETEMNAEQSKVQSLEAELKAEQSKPKVFTASGPVPIPDNDSYGASLPITVQGITGSIEKVTVKLHVSHSYAGDLDISLIGPGGTTINLSTNKGGGDVNYGRGCPADDNDTIFDDSASASITAGSPPFAGAFRPEQMLSAFAGKSGTAVNGTWRLRVVDDSDIATGSIQCWSLWITSVATSGRP